MLAVTEEVLDEMVAAIAQEIDPERIYLFGSRARGDARPDSDIDLLIVEQKPFSPCHSRWKELARIRRTLSQFRISKDILLYSTEEMARWQHSIHHILFQSLREGKLLYERPRSCTPDA